MREEKPAVAHYALEGLPNKILAAEYRTTLPDEETVASELDRVRKVLEERKMIRKAADQSEQASSKRLMKNYSKEEEEMASMVKDRRKQAQKKKTPREIGKRK